MIEIMIPGHAKLQLKHLILDYNGTLAVDGQLLDGVRESLEKLSGKLHIHVITADTFGKAQSGLSGIDCKLSILALDNQDIGKLEYVKNLGASSCVCIGNGRNDRLMLKEASLGLAVIQTEGVAFETLQASDMVCNSIVHALELLIYPLRLTASLRS
jgi:soluble P-type ATPase